MLQYLPISQAVLSASNMYLSGVSVNNVIRIQTAATKSSGSNHIWSINNCHYAWISRHECVRVEAQIHAILTSLLIYKEHHAPDTVIPGGENTLHTLSMLSRACLNEVTKGNIYNLHVTKSCPHLDDRSTNSRNRVGCSPPLACRQTKYLGHCADHSRWRGQSLSLTSMNNKDQPSTWRLWEATWRPTFRRIDFSFLSRSVQQWGSGEGFSQSLHSKEQNILPSLHIYHKEKTQGNTCEQSHINVA